MCLSRFTYSHKWDCLVLQCVPSKDFTFRRNIEISDPYLMVPLLVCLCLTFSRGGSKVVGNFDISFRACLWIPPSNILGFLHSFFRFADCPTVRLPESLWSLAFPLAMYFSGGIQSSWKDCFVTASDVLVSLLYAFCLCRSVTDKGYMVCLLFSTTIFILHPSFVILYE